MNGIADRIARRASEINLKEINWDACLWAEQIPRFYRHETDSETDPYIMKHLEICEECNTLLMALAAQSPPNAGFFWIKQGVRQVLNQTVRLRGIIPAGIEGQFAQAPALRGSRENYSPSEEKISLPDGSSLFIKVIDIDVKSHKQILTASMSDGTRRRYELRKRSGGIMKSIDNANEIDIVMPDDGVVLIIDDRFEIDLGRDTEIPES